MTGPYKNSKRSLVLAVILKNPRLSLREICEITGIKSTGAVYYHLVQLEKDGLIERRPLLSRSITLTKKTRILKQKGAAGLDMATLKRIEKIGKREDESRRIHSTDVIDDYRHRKNKTAGLKCTRLG